MANANHIFCLARAKYLGIHWWQDAGIKIRSLLLFENPVRVAAICSSFPREQKWQDRKRSALVLPICSNLRWKWSYSSSVRRPGLTWKHAENFQKINEGFLLMDKKRKKILHCNKVCEWSWLVSQWHWEELKGRKYPSLPLQKIQNMTRQNGHNESQECLCVWVCEKGIISISCTATGFVFCCKYRADEQNPNMELNRDSALAPD